MATINEITPNIRQFTFRQERDDPDFGSCMWASFILDCKNYTLQIASDCGNYSYGWAPTPKRESFVKLMSRIYDDYLLEKIEFMSVFDYEKSFNNIIECLKDDGASDEEIERFKEHMEYESEIGLADVSDEEFKKACREGLANIDREDVFDCFDYGGCVYDYPTGAKKIVEIFCEYLQPLLKEEAENANQT